MGQISLEDAYRSVQPTQQVSLEDAYGSSSPSSVDPHSTKSAFSNAYQGTKNLLSNAASGAWNAASHPIDTAGNVIDSVTDLPGIAEGADRAVRSLPGVGQALQEVGIAAQGIPAYIKGGDDAGLNAVNAQDEFRANQQRADAQHMQEHPLTDFIQKNVGLTALPANIGYASGMLAVDAFSKSITAGNTVTDALKDAKNAGLLSAIAMGSGKLAMGGRSSGEADTASQAEAPATAPISEPTFKAAPEHGPIPGWPTKEEYLAARHPDQFPEPAPEPMTTVPPPLPIAEEAAPPSLAPEPQPSPGAAPEPSQRFEKAGKFIGRAGGGFAGHKMGGYPGAAIGVVVGGEAGKAIGSQLDSVVAKYGPEAAKTVSDAGIKIANIANTPYLAPIMEAAKRGSVPLAVAHYLLEQSDPKYQQMQAMSMQQH